MRVSIQTRLTTISSWCDCSFGVGFILPILRKITFQIIETLKSIINSVRTMNYRSYIQIILEGNRCLPISPYTRKDLTRAIVNIAKLLNTGDDAREKPFPEFLSINTCIKERKARSYGFVVTRGSEG